MKKKVLLALFLALFPICGWGSCPPPTIACPEDRPYFIGTTLLEYFRSPHLKKLNTLKKLIQPWQDEIPDFQFEEECEKAQDPVCQKLDEVKRYQEEFKKWHLSNEKDKINQKNKIILVKNKLIHDKNSVVDSKNKLYAGYNTIISVREFNEPCGDVDFVLGAEGVLSPLIDIDPKTALQKAVKDYLERAWSVIDQNSRIINQNEFVYKKNQEIEKINAEIERENAEIEKQFLDYYTPEKTEQLIKDYEKAIAEQCLGCDYPEPLSVSKYDCQKCPERIFVDDKCILRESYFKNKKGVKK